MTNEYQRWLREQEIEQAAMRGVQAPPQQRATIESDVAVPTLQALVIGTVGGLAAGTATLLVGFGVQGWGRLWLSGKVCGGGFVFVLAGCIWGLRITSAYLLSARLGLVGIWWAVAIDLSGRALLLGLRFRSGKWKSVKV